MSRLDELTREELTAPILKQHETVKRLEERMTVLEGEVDDLYSKFGDGKGAPEWMKPNRKQHREE